MASNQAYDGPRPPIGNTPHAQQQGHATRISPPLVAARIHLDAGVPSTRASVTRPKPSWLLPARPSRPNKPVPSSTDSTHVSIDRRPMSRTDSGLLRASPEPHSAPETALETVPTFLHCASASVSASTSAAPADTRPPADRAGKRKAAEEAPPRDIELRRASIAVAAWGRGGSMFIDADESSKIMRNSKESRAAAAVKNQRRRVTVAGGEARDVGTLKRVKSAAAASDDDDTDTLLTWRRKIRALPAASSSVSRTKGKGVVTTSAASGVTCTPRATGTAANSNLCGPGLGVIDQEAPSILRDGTTRFSAPRGLAPPGETAAPSEEIARVDAEPETMLPTPGGETADETRPTTNAQPMKRVAPSSLVRWTTGNARPAMPEVSAPLPAQPLSEELGLSGDPSDLMLQSGGPSELMDDGSRSCSDVPLSLLVSPPRSARKRALPAEEPLRSKKGKGKGKAKACASEPRNGLSYVDGFEKETSLDTGVSDFLAAAAIAPLSSSKGKSTKAKKLVRMSHIEGNASTTPRKRPRAQSHHTSEESSSDTDVVPQVPTAQISRPRTKSLWRVVEPPKSLARPTQRLAAPSSRPRVWAGSKDELLAALPALAKNEGGVAWESLGYPTLIFSGERGDPGLGWWDEDVWESRRIIFSINRETGIPLADPPDQPSVSSAHDSTPDGGHTTVGTQLPPEKPSSPLFDDDGTPMVPRSALWNPKTGALSSSEKDADPPRINVESPTGAAPSQLIDPMEVPSGGLDSYPSILKPKLRCIRTNAGDHSAASSMPCGAGATPDGCPSSDHPTAEVIRVDGPPSFDGQISLSHADGSQPGGVSACDTGSDFPEARGAGLPCPAPLSTREHPTDHSPQAGPVCPSPSESAHPSAILPPRPAALDPDATPSCAVSVPPFGSENPLPQPPPMVAALLTAQSFGNVVAPVLARDSPLVPWELPPEIGYFWLGLFRISEVKVETQLRRSTTSKAPMVQCTWRFYLEWVSGGEDQLKDEEEGDYEWPTRIMRPWWEPERCQQPDQYPMFGPSQSAASLMLESRHDTIITGPSPRYPHLLLPLPLLAPFTANSTAAGNFPAGYYCTACGRINVQRFLRHRICEGTTCDSRTDPQRETGWVISAYSTRDRKVNSATVVPDDKWTAPTTAELATAFDDGARLFHYHLAVCDPGPSAAPSSLRPSGAGADADADPHAHAHALSVRHVFNGNREPLQRDASALFETLQRDVPIERSIGASAFATPQIESGDDPALGRNGRSVWDQQAACIEGALNTYCRDLGPLKVRALRVHAWISDGKHVQTFCPRAEHLVLLCLGADIALLAFPSDPTTAKPNGKTKKKKECLRVTMVHGDIVVLDGCQSFKFSTVRTGMCMLLEAECIQPLCIF